MSEQAGPAPQRRTRQRVAVNGILSGLHEFRTAQQIHDELIHHGDRVGLATVYRTLQAMTDAGELDAIRTSDGETAYRRCTTGHHHHLVCRSCGRTIECQARPSRPGTRDCRGARLPRHQSRLGDFGTCGNCGN
jgi:Fur family ferric uptake transcriptional regulator